jgi:hypothetical protein
MDDDSQMKAGAEGGIRPDAPGIRVHETGRNAGVTNQESQTVDDQGGIHVLNRELLEGTERWYASVQSAPVCIKKPCRADLVGSL